VASWSDGCECGGGHCARVPQSDFGDDGGDVEERKDGVGRRFSGCKLAADIRGESQEHTEGRTEFQKRHNSALRSRGRTRTVPPHDDGASSIALRVREEEVSREERDCN